MARNASHRPWGPSLLLALILLTVAPGGRARAREADASAGAGTEESAPAVPGALPLAVAPPEVLPLAGARGAGRTASRPENSLGISGSYSYLGATWCYQRSRRTFHSLSLMADFHGLVTGESTSSFGFFLRYGYHFSLLESNHTGEGFGRFYAGPGACIGYLTDQSCGYGLLMGFCAQLGYEYCFPRRISAGIQFSPVFGFHAHLPAGAAPTMDVYTTGILRTLVPELSLRYDF